MIHYYTNLTLVLFYIPRIYVFTCTAVCEYKLNLNGIPYSQHVKCSWLLCVNQCSPHNTLNVVGYFVINQCSPDNTLNVVGYFVINQCSAHNTLNVVSYFVINQCSPDNTLNVVGYFVINQCSAHNTLNVVVVYVYSPTFISLA